ncbi:hypothetical protein [Bordetella genomosp. 11]|uniref:RecT family protein n=1 Tax=Bordetella genomosp. 11 TaxID=1416808 RepID=A0A261UER0_9BORD|nr:hypothetical protein [Bordetella genomosp. 11]OZI59912.1 hypothetical protein CAL28_10510 [Bordetella genomosp. 11]
MPNEVTTQQSNEPVQFNVAQTFDLSPRSLDEALRLADYLASSDMVPKDYKDKPGNCLVAMQWGMEVGLKPLQAIQNIAVINGRPNLWGDAMLALVRSSPLCEYVTESEENGIAICRAKRRGEPETVRTFSDEDAKTAGLKGKQGPWQTAPKRMKQLRARAFALRDAFTDVLKGMSMAEETMDHVPIERDITPPRTAAEFAQQAKPQPAVAVDRDAIVKEMEDAARGKGTPEQRVATLNAIWQRIGKDGRAAAGRDTYARLFDIANAVDTETNTSPEPQGEAGNPAQDAATAGPASQVEGDDNPFEGAE